MNYYTLPKTNNKIKLEPNISGKIVKPYISQTLLNYHDEIKDEVNHMYFNNKNHNISYEEIIKIVNPYEYIFSRVPGSNYSVSKLKTKSNMFYELFEIIQTIDLLDSFKFDIMNSLIVGENYEDSLECLEMLRENYNIDKFFCFYEYNSKLHSCIEKNKFNFVIYELNKYNDVNQNIINLLELLIIVFTQLKENSIIIIKLNNTFYKPILEILYLFNSLFEKTLVIKPNTSDITSFDKYIILQKLRLNQYYFDLFNNYNTVISDFIKNYNNKLEINNYNNITNNLHIQTIIKHDLPMYFLNKIDDINIIVGQQQLEAVNQIINMLKSKNIEDRIEIMKKNNIQKSVNWCEKFKIPCNKFSDKINIFFQ